MALVITLGTSEPTVPSPPGLPAAAVGRVVHVDATRSCT